jgi:hypothetical protein
MLVGAEPLVAVEVIVRPRPPLGVEKRLLREDCQMPFRGTLESATVHGAFTSRVRDNGHRERRNADRLVGGVRGDVADV